VSGGLHERIAEEIRRSGPIPFSRYMELCLYEPELGYYSQPRERFGKAGDFYTSSDVHAVFGRLLARYFEKSRLAMGSPSRLELIELGPGRGLFARDVLDWSPQHFPGFAAALHYSLVEQSAHLRERLQERLAEHIAAARCAVWATLEEAVAHTLPAEEPSGVILFANEFFDALPVEILDARGAVRVDVEDGRFVERFVQPTAAELDFIDRYSVRPEEGERVEVPLISLEWMDRMARSVHGRRACVVLIDYGYTREEQIAGRHRDTIMTYRQHVASATPYHSSGEQDITAHVNFSALRERAIEAGLVPQALLTQSQFLIGIGEETQFADVFAECRLPQERAKVALQLKHLISPSGMGEAFQVLLLSTPHSAGTTSAANGSRKPKA